MLTPQKSRLEDIHHVAHFDRLVEAVEAAQHWAQELGDDPKDPSYTAGEKTRVAIYQLVEVIKDKPTSQEKERMGIACSGQSLT